MIVIDTSALTAILLRETEAERFAQAIEEDEEPLISASSVVELYVVMKYKQGPATQNLVDKLLLSAAITICPVTEKQAKIAGQAAHRFSVLNYGDTFSYALAQDYVVPLLFKGNDFSQTDVEVAQY